MFAENGEKLEARAAARMIICFWLVVKTEYVSGFGGARRGVVSVSVSMASSRRVPLCLVGLVILSSNVVFVGRDYYTLEDTLH